MSNNASTASFLGSDWFRFGTLPQNNVPYDLIDIFNLLTSVANLVGP